MSETTDHIDERIASLSKVEHNALRGKRVQTGYYGIKWQPHRQYISKSAAKALRKTGLIIKGSPPFLSHTTLQMRERLCDASS